MNCNDANEYMMRYFDGIQNDIEIAQLKQHLKSCTSCSETFESLKEIFSTIEAENPIEPPQDFEVNVMEKINALEVSRKKRTDGFLVFSYSFVTVILTAIAVVFMARLNGINLYDLISSSDESFSSFPETLFTIFNLLNAIYHICVKIGTALFHVASAVTGTYYFMIAVLLGFFILIPRAFTGLTKQEERNKV